MIVIIIKLLILLFGKILLLHKEIKHIHRIIIKFNLFRKDKIDAGLNQLQNLKKKLFSDNDSNDSVLSTTIQLSENSDDGFYLASQTDDHLQDILTTAFVNSDNVKNKAPPININDSKIVNLPVKRRLDIIDNQKNKHQSVMAIKNNPVTQNVTVIQCNKPPVYKNIQPINKSFIANKNISINKSPVYKNTQPINKNIPQKTQSFNKTKIYNNAPNKSTSYSQVTKTKINSNSFSSLLPDCKKSSQNISSLPIVKPISVINTSGDTSNVVSVELDDLDINWDEIDEIESSQSSKSNSINIMKIENKIVTKQEPTNNFSAINDMKKSTSYQLKTSNSFPIKNTKNNSPPITKSNTLPAITTNTTNYNAISSFNDDDIDWDEIENIENSQGKPNNPFNSSSVEKNNKINTKSLDERLWDNSSEPLSLDNDVYIIKYMQLKVNKTSSTNIPEQGILLETTHIKTNEKLIVLLCGLWKQCIPPNNSIINVIQDYPNNPVIYNGIDIVISNSQHWIIINPMRFVTTTMISTSFHCIRKVVLDDYFYTNLTSKAMIYGLIKHDLFEYALQNKINDEKILCKHIVSVLPKYYDKMIQSEMTNEDIDSLKDMIGFIINYVNTFLLNDASGPIPFNSKIGHLKIKDIISVEDSIYSPLWGIKGVVDVVTNSILSVESQPKTLIFPLEFKTGKKNSYTSLSHNAQLLLYSLLLSEVYGTHPFVNNKPCGNLVYLASQIEYFLYYIHSPKDLSVTPSQGYITEGINTLLYELKSIINQRNILSEYSLEKSNIDIEDFYKVYILYNISYHL